MAQKIVRKDIPIPMRDGLKLSADVYLPAKPGVFPVVMCFTSYGKDVFWSERHPGWGVAYIPHSPNVIGSSPFEAEDPNFWTIHDYVVMVVDGRGHGRSPGRKSTDGPYGVFAYGIISLGSWAHDMFDAIEWAGKQEWSNGNVGLSGVSLLAFSQWRVAALNPSHLKAICPWEGWADPHRDVRFPGGIPETAFSTSRGRPAQLVPPHDPAWPAEKEEPPILVEKEEDEFMAEITVPALICATWSDHGCHTRGSFRAFRKISSKLKWLYIHGRHKWAEFYSPEALAFRKMFFDYFLKNTDNRILQTPRVKLEVRETLDKYIVRWEDDFPIPRTQYKKLYLDAIDRKLKFDKNDRESKASYDSTRNEKAAFDHVFERHTELTGYMNARLWFSPEEADDMDLFITLRKFDRDGKEVYFEGATVSPAKYPVAFGWLRLSLRKLDEEKSTPYEPYLESVVGPGKKVKQGEIVSCEIPILPSGTLFREGETLRLEISGRYRGGERVEAIVPFRFTEVVNKGIHSIYTGGKFDSYLLIPYVPQAS